MSIISASTATNTAYKVTADTTGTLVLQTGATPTTAVTIDGSQNVGIGTSSPAGKLDIRGVGAVQQYIISTSATTQNNSIISLCNTGAAYSSLVLDGADQKFNISGTERARIDSSGNLLVGQTASGLQNAYGLSLGGAATGGNIGVNHASGSGSGSSYAYFGYNASQIGSITQAGTTGVLYNITSDYRLKEVIGPVTDAGARIDALEPIEYQWKSDGSNTRGFLAHKFQEVYPQSVSGEKDAVDEEGNPQYQNMQAGTSEVIADLIAEIQSLRKRLTALENK